VTWGRRIGVPFFAVMFVVMVIVDHAAAQLQWPLLFVGAGAMVFTLRAFDLKKVELEGADLIISNFGREARVPLSAVSSVKGGRGGKTAIKIEFRTDTEFGSSIRFTPLPPIGIMWPWTPHPLVNQLRQLCGLTTPPDKDRE
jgi:hypothetical protein